MTNKELLQLVRKLRAVRRGETFEAGECRVLFIEVRAAEKKLDKQLTTLFDARLKAEERFCLGWKDFEDKAPWALR